MSEHVVPIAPDEPTVRQFFEIYHEAAAVAFEGVADPGILQLVRLWPDDASPTQVVGRFSIGAVEAMTQAAIADASAGFNVYVEGRTVRRSLAPNERGREGDTRGVFASVVDADADKGRDSDLGEIEPSLCVESSPGNRHEWLFLRRAITLDEAKELGTSLRLATGADSDTGNPVQPYRVAGTPNFPGPKKQARGRVAVPTSILTEGRNYEAVELRALLPAPQPTNSITVPQASSACRPARDANDLLASLLPKRLDDLATTEVADRSAHFLKVTGWLKGDGFALDEAVTLWESFPESAGAAKYGARLAREVARVWAKVGDDPDETAKIAANGAEIAERMRANTLAKTGSGSASSAASDLIPIISASDFAGRPKPKREFLDERGMIPMRNVTLLYGDGGTGKSLLTLQLGIAVTATGNWVGARTRRGPVLYISAEDDEEETHARLIEISEAEGFDLSDAADLRIAVMAGRDCVMAIENGRSSVLSWTQVFDGLQERMTELRPVLLVIDNLADVFGANENVKTFARQFVSRLRGLAIEFECAVMMLAHPSQSGMSSGNGTSGNVGWSNSARSRLYLYRDVDETGHEANVNRRTLENKKANYGPRGTTVPVEWQSGRFLCLDAPPSEAKPMEGTMKVLRAQRVFLEMVRRYNAQGRNISPSRSPSYAPPLFARHPHAEGVKAREFETAMETLLECGEIAVELVGPPSKRRQNIIIPTCIDDASDPFQSVEEAAA